MQVSSDSEDSSDVPSNLALTTQVNKMSTEEVTEKLDGMGSLKLASPPHAERLKPKQEEKPVETQGEAFLLLKSEDIVQVKVTSKLMA